MKYEVRWVKAWMMCMPPYEFERHGVFDTLEEAQQSVRDWWQRNDYEPSYVCQMADDEGNIWWDYGLHSSFYVFKEVAE